MKDTDLLLYGALFIGGIYILERSGIFKVVSSITKPVADSLAEAGGPVKSLPNMANLVTRLGFKYKIVDNNIFVYGPDNQTIGINVSDLNRTDYIKRRAAIAGWMPASMKFNFVFG